MLQAMRSTHCVSAILLLAASGIVSAEPARVTDEASAVAVAKKYVKAQCTERPCHFKPRREGSLWNVLVEFTKPTPAGKLERYPGGHVLLYFNQEGQLVRRVKGE